LKVVVDSDKYLEERTGVGLLWKVQQCDIRRRILARAQPDIKFLKNINSFVKKVNFITCK
jgi:hypothetical protein